MTGMLLTVISPTADILGDPREPHRISNNDSQLLYGEQFYVEESHGAYVYGYGIIDEYSGYVERGQLGQNYPKTTHYINTRETHFYPEPDFKSRPLLSVPFLSRVPITEETSGDFTKTEDGYWIYSANITPIGHAISEQDMAQTATLYLGTPYVYGGRSTRGIDCSGLIQNAMIAHGYACPPRDSGNQKGAFGEKTDPKKLERNDIVFFEGHVGIMMDDKYILNATARHMNTVIEEIDKLIEHYGKIEHVARL